MSRRLWGACASEQGMMGAALGPDRLSLRINEPGKANVGWGIGFYEGGEPLVRKRPREEREDLDLLGVVAETRSDLLLGHVREPTVGSLRAENTHPFRFRQWLCAHSGTIGQFAEIRPRLLDAMPSFLQRSLGGETDSEVFFHLVLAFLHDARQLDNQRVEAQVAGEMLAKAVLMVDELEQRVTAGHRSSFNVLLTNGNFLVALRRNPCELKYQTYTAPWRDEILPRVVIVACEKTALGSGWTSMPDQSILKISRDLSLEVSTF